MLTPGHWQTIFGFVKDFLADTQRIPHPVPPYRRGQVHREGLLAICRRFFFPALDERLGGDADSACVDPWEWRLAGVLSYLSLVGASRIPQAICDHCMKEAAAVPGIGNPNDRGETARLVDVALALAAGWHRPPLARDGDWDSPWPLAQAELIEMAAEIIDRVCVGFAYGATTPYPGGFKLPPVYRIREWAEACVTRFLAPWREVPGHPEYETYQTIHTWDPGPGREGLYGWLRHCITGQPGELVHVQLNYFRNGLLYPEMKADKCLAIERVAEQGCIRLREGTDLVSRLFDTAPMCDACDVKECPDFQEPFDENGRLKPLFFIYEEEHLIYPPLWGTSVFYSYSPTALDAEVRLRVPSRAEFFYEHGESAFPFGKENLSDVASHLYVRLNLMPIINIPGRIDMRVLGAVHDAKGDRRPDMPAPAPDADHEGLESRDVLGQMLSKLPLRQAAIVRLLDIERLKPEEAAARLCVTPDEVKDFHKKARASMKKMARKRVGGPRPDRPDSGAGAGDGPGPPSPPTAVTGGP